LDGLPCVPALPALMNAALPQGCTFPQVFSCPAPLLCPLPCHAAEALEAGKQLARQHGCIVGISGAVDLVTDGTRVLRAANGVPLLQQITATGCSGARQCAQ
jgi:hypothetical protein